MFAPGVRGEQGYQSIYLRRERNVEGSGVNPILRHARNLAFQVGIVYVCVCVCVSKNDQALAKLQPWTAVSAYLGLISKVQSSAGA